MAGLLYCSAGLGLWGYARLGPSRGEASLRREDWPALLTVVLVGGALAPVCMLVGLARISGLSGALLLNLEAPFTIVLAVAIFREHLVPREWAGAALILVAAAALGWDPTPGSPRPGGALLVAAACLCWAVDNNLTQRLSLRDPVRLVQVKTLGAGAFNLMLALALGTALPAAGWLAPVATLGLLSYGVSIVFGVLAMRHLGAARYAALFSVAPFAGAGIAALCLPGEGWTAATSGVAAAMAVGVGLMTTARHSHAHQHDPIEHDHVHTHDEHHAHAHGGEHPVEPHAHPHRHDAVAHDHEHLSDVHHRHPHA